jgi:hypothetical protein
MKKRHLQLAEDQILVVFRVYPDGEVIALMPYEVEDEFGHLCVCAVFDLYVRVGHYDGANPQIVVSQTAPATPKQYRPLLKELTQLGYKVVVRRRIPSDATERRRQQLRESIGSIK